MAEMTRQLRSAAMNMKRLIPLAAFICLLSCAGAAAAENEVLHFELGLDWKLGSDTEKHGHVTIEYLRRGDDPNNWKELLTYNNGPRTRSQRSPEEEVQRSPEEEVKTLKADMEKRCPGASQWNVIAQDENSILFEWQSRPCPASDEHQITRIIHGKHNWFGLLCFTPQKYTNWRPI